MNVKESWLAVQLESDAPRTILYGGKSSWTKITVSALWTQFISGKIAEVNAATER